MRYKGFHHCLPRFYFEKNILHILSFFIGIASLGLNENYRPGSFTNWEVEACDIQRIC
jgi:hypothetical protein